MSRPIVTDELRALIEPLLAQRRDADLTDFSRPVDGSPSVCAARGGEKMGPSPVDHRKSGSKHLVLVDAGHRWPRSSPTRTIVPG